ncbi:MAG TPA: TIGR03667 family PPOX class F420-dependent oxidoreductase [Acidimicrobiia bacterium]|nr:TIGR03667 family PPOX class F420-dependent oxidoreductase [Acidimicrobiia bacterium]
MLDPADPRHARALRRLAAEPVIWLTTVRPNGQAQTSPVWYLFEDGGFLVYSKEGTARTTNLDANPRVALNLDGDHFGGEVVTIEGRATVDAGAPPASEHDAYVEKYRLLMRRNGWTPEDFAAGYPVAIRITPTRARAW